MAKRRIILVLVICFSIAVFAVQTPSQTRSSNRTVKRPDPERLRFGTKVADLFNVRWRSIVYEKMLYNPELTSSKQGQPKAESLSLSCEIEMPDPQLVLATCPNATIEQITDRQGRKIEIGLLPSRSTFMYMENPRSKRRRTFIGTAGLPARQSTRSERNSLRLELDARLGERVGGEIGRLRGRFRALIAESLEYVEVPFAPNDDWVRLTPEVEVRVREAQNVASMYHFNIEQRPEIAPHLGSVHVGDYLPSRLVVGRQFLGQSSGPAGGGGSSGRIGGKGSGIGRAERIRYVIAVNPAHYNIPFEIEHIPLPFFAYQAVSQTRTSSQTAMLPVMQHLQNRALERRESRFETASKHPKSGLSTKVAKQFKVHWHSITYSKMLNNPAASPKDQDQKVSESLSFRCEAEILDPKLVVGTCDEAIIEQITDSKGRDTDISRAQPCSNRMYYSALRYRPKPTLPSKLAQWEGKTRLALGIPLKARNLPKLSTELQPVRMVIQLDPQLLGQGQGEIGCVKGYFHALTAESFEHIKVPFETNNKWVRLTSDVEIQVVKAWHDGFAYRYDIKQRGQGGVRAYRLYVEDRLPSGIVLDRHFKGAGGQPNRLVSGGRSLPGPIGGSGSYDRDYRIETIDYLIAVNLTHHKIPFELEHIPLPNP